MLYNADHAVFQWCDGTQWIGLPKPTGTDIASGLVGHWRFDDGSGSTATDSSGSGNHGSLVNMDSAAWVDGKIGGALDFGGAADLRYVEIPDSPDLRLISGQSTVAAWIYPQGWGQNNQGRIVDRGGANVDDSWVLRIRGDGSTRRLEWWVNDDLATLGSTDSIVLDQWQHVAAVQDGSNVTLYVNGVEVGSRTDSPIPGDAARDVRIGINALNTERGFDGLIDDVRIYDRALSEAEIEALYEQGSAGAGCEAGEILYNADHAIFQWCDGTQWIGFRKPGSSSGDEVTDGLVGWWKFDDGSGTVAADSAGSNDGTLVNGPGWKLESDCQVGQCLEFDGTNRVDVGDQQALKTMTEEMTIAFWARPDNLSNQDIMGKEGGASARSYKIAMRDYVLAGGIEWVVASDATTQVEAYSSTTGLSAGIWQHIAVTFKANEYMQIYINGVQVDSTETDIIPSQNFLDNGFPHNIGARGGNLSSTAFFNGLIDDVRIYDRALSAQEIEAIYNCGAGISCGEGGEESPCSDPGHMLYNADFDVLQWCDGENWIGLPKPE